MKVLLINPRLPVYLRMPSLPLGLLSIASFLKAQDHEVRLLDRSMHNEGIKEEVLRFQPGVIGISALSYLSSLDAKSLTEELREYTDVPVIWGGPAPSSLPEMYLRDGKPDFVMLGEGEYTWLAVAEALEAGAPLYDLQGLAYLRGHTFVCNPPRPLADLKTFPDLDWSLVDPAHYFSSFFNCSRMLYLHASKGCTASCTFCSNKQFHQSRNRCRDPKQVVRDIEYLVSECGADGIYFSDELFVPVRSVRSELMALLAEKNLDFVWGCQMRIGVLNEEDIRQMYRAGCRWILFGIESGDTVRLKKIKKGIDPGMAKETVDWCKKAGITVQTSFIIGFPYETPQEMQKTIDFAKSLQADMIVMNILTAIPNSEIYDQMLREKPGFRLPQTIAEIAKKELVATDQVTDNLSEIPALDLHVVHFFYQWKAFIGRGTVKGESFGIIKKMASDTFDRLFRHGLKGFVFGAYFSLKQFLTVFFYANCFPHIRKKYKLE